MWLGCHDGGIGTYFCSEEITSNPSGVNTMKEVVFKSDHEREKL